MGLKKDKFVQFIKNMNDTEKQRAITWLAYIGTIALAVLTSCLTLFFDFANFNPGYFFCQLAFNIAFSLIMLILSLKDGRLSNENRKSGELYDLKNEYRTTVVQIVDDDSFRDWNDALYEKERQSYVMSELAKPHININDYQYLLISEQDLNDLRNGPKENIPYRLSRHDKEMKYVTLDQISEVQYTAIKYYRSGKYRFNKINHSFFKSTDGKNEYKYFADTQDSDKKAQFWAFFYRIMTIVVFSGITALAVINPTKSSGQTVAYETLSRIVNVLLSMFFGYSLAHDEMRRAIKRIRFIIRMIRQYLADLFTGVFVPKNRDEKIRIKINEIRALRLKEEEDKINSLLKNKNVSNEQFDNKNELPTTSAEVVNNDNVDKEEEESIEIKPSQLAAVKAFLKTLDESESK